MQDFLAFLQNSKTKDFSQQQITQILLKIQNDINKNSFNIKEEKLENEIREILEFLFFSINVQSFSLKLAVERSMKIFLTKNYPFFPKNIERVFLSIAKSQTTFDSEYSSCLIIELFSFIIQKISVMRMEDFVDKANIFKFFTKKCQPIFDLLPKIIPSLKCIGFKWHKNLLKQFIKSQIEFYQIKTINAIIINYPKLSKYIFKTNNIQLLSYILSTFENKIKIPNDFDIENILSILANTKSIAEIDNCLSIFSSYQEYYKKRKAKHKKSGSNNQFNVAIKDDEVIFETSISSQKIPIQKLIGRSGFYKLDGLPLNLLIPSNLLNSRKFKTDEFNKYRDHDDTLFVLNAKFKKLASLASDEKEKIFTIYKEYFLLMNHNEDKQNEFISPCLQSLPLCITFFEKNKEYPSFLLNNVMNHKPSSWVDAVDICRIFEALSPSSFAYIGGIKNVIYKLIDFATTKNDSLYQAACNAIIKISNSSNCDLILQCAYQKFDYFHQESFIKLLNLTINLSKKNGYYNSIFSGILDIGYEFITLDQFNSSMSLLSETISLATSLNILNMNPYQISLTKNKKKFFLDNFNAIVFLQKISLNLIYAYIKFFIGESIITPLTQGLPQMLASTKYIDLFFNMINDNTVTVDNDNLCQCFNLLLNSLEFLKVYGIPKYDRKILYSVLCEDLIKIFPCEVSELISHSIIQLIDKNKEDNSGIGNSISDFIDLFFKAFESFSYTKDIEAGSIWCQGYSILSHNTGNSANQSTFPNKTAKMQEIDDKICPVFENMATFAFSNPKKVSLKCLNSLALFLAQSNSLKSKFPLLIDTIPFDQFKTKVLSYLYSTNPMLFYEIFPNIDDTPFQELDDYSSSESFDNYDNKVNTIFEKVMFSDLSRNDERKYIIKTQLKFSLVKYSLENLLSFIQQFLSEKKVDFEAILLIILYASKNNIELPQNTFSNYLYDKNDDIYFNLYQKIQKLDNMGGFQNNNLSYKSLFINTAYCNLTYSNIIRLLNIYSLNLKIGKIVSQEKLKKKSLHEIMNIINSSTDIILNNLKIKMEYLLEFALIIVTKADEDQYKLRYALLLLASIVKKCNDGIDEHFISQFASIYKEIQLPFEESMKCLRVISEKFSECGGNVKDSKLLNVISSANRILDIFISPSAADLLVSNMLFMARKDNFDTSQYWNRLFNFKEIPSFFIRGSFLIINLIKISKNQNKDSNVSSVNIITVLNNLKNAPQILVDSYKILHAKAKRNSEVDRTFFECSKKYLDFLCGNSVVMNILKNLDLFLVSSSEASFALLSSTNLLRVIIKIIHNNSSASLQVSNPLSQQDQQNIITKLSSYSKSLKKCCFTNKNNNLFISPNILVLEAYSTLLIELQLIENPRNIAMGLEDAILEWVQFASSNDSYDMTYRILFWLNATANNLNPERALNLACTTFYKYIPRFFNLFASIAIFLQERRRNLKKSDEYLTNAAVVNTCRAHSEAFRLLIRYLHLTSSDNAQKGIIYTALKLSQFENDCEESDSLINSIVKEDL